MVIFDHIASAVVFLVYNAAMHRIKCFRFAQRDWKQAYLKKAGLKTKITNLCSKGSTRMMELFIVSSSTCVRKNPGTEADVSEHVEVALRSMMCFAPFIFSMSPNTDACFYFAQVTKWNLNSNAVTNPQNLKARSFISTQPWYLNFRACEKPLCLHTHIFFGIDLFEWKVLLQKTKGFHHAATNKRTIHTMSPHVTLFNFCAQCAKWSGPTSSIAFCCASATTLPGSITVINILSMLNQCELPP